MVIIVNRRQEDCLNTQVSVFRVAGALSITVASEVT